MSNNTYGEAGDFFNSCAAVYAEAAKQANALGLHSESEELEKKSAHCCELFALFRAASKRKKS